MENRVATEDTMLFSEIAIHAEIGLILIIGLGSSAHEIVCASDIRHRIVRENLGSHRIELRWLNRIAGDRIVRDRIEYRLRENHAALRNRRHHAESRNAG